jgi:ribosomal protein L37AE/L43A
MKCHTCRQEIYESSTVCEFCGTPVKTQTTPILRFTGQNAAEGIEFVVNKDNPKIGRMDNPEAESLYCNEWTLQISRHHCEINFICDKCYITHTQGHTPTYLINSIRMDLMKHPNTPFELNDGDTVAFAEEQYAFTVKFEYSDPEPVIERKVALVWKIQCQNCKRKYTVDNEKSTIEVCPHCGDTDISFEEAVQVEEEAEL